MGCCAGKLQFHKETKRQDKNEYLAAARAVEQGAGLTQNVHMDMAATLAPWPRKHGAPSLQVTFDMVWADNVRSA